MSRERRPSSPRPPARVVLADDHDLAREGLRSPLEREQELRVVGEATTGREALALCRQLRPDLGLMDVRMLDMDGLEATRAIGAEQTAVGVLVVTMHEDPDYVV